jgi:hypothetical protein
MERLELEGKPITEIPKILITEVFRRPNNNVPQIMPREQRNRDRDDQRIQTPLQNNLVDDEEGEEEMSLTLKFTVLKTPPLFPI